MKIIKLSAIDSTNSFLKGLALSSPLKDYTVVVTNNQTKGRGQMNTSWTTEPNKNLTFSIFKNLNNIEITHQAYLSFAVCLAVFDTLKELKTPDLFIKWPNDIMADNKKICGILIETTFKKNSIKNTIVGIGVNVNQQKFSKELGNVSSLKNLLDEEFSTDQILEKIVLRLKEKIADLEQGNFKKIHEEFNKYLYKKNKLSEFYNNINRKKFSGKIVGVNSEGKLLVKILDNNSIQEFEAKQIQLLTT